jgi:hypothetical protein
MVVVCYRVLSLLRSFTSYDNLTLQILLRFCSLNSEILRLIAEQ